ncbi:hypothetical protein OS035_10950, partial [Rhizobium sp. 268]|uniref:hypothetical protein n=1 Tax=Rhizobium sp. 268 TaxID=2996375 RepID=UPI002F95CFF5
PIGDHKWKIPVPNGLNYWGHVNRHRDRTSILLDLLVWCRYTETVDPIAGKISLNLFASSFDSSLINRRDLNGPEP